MRECHQWDRGVLDSSSWHGLEEVGVFGDAASMVAHGEGSGAWPVDLDLLPLFTTGGIKADERGVVAGYREPHAPRVVGVVGSRYTATTPAAWRTLVAAAVEAGAKPTGAFSLRGGRVVIGTFEVNGRDDGIAQHLLLTDSFDGSSKLMVGTTTVRVVCANTLARALRSNGAGMAQLRHSSSINEKAMVLAAEIDTALETGRKMREVFAAAQDKKLARSQAEHAFDLLFPPAPEGSDRSTVSRAENVRAEGRAASVLAVNNVGANVATLWNAATYLVDRHVDGSPRKPRSGDMLDSLLFGKRGERVEEIQNIVEVIMRDGSVERVTVPEMAQREGAKQDFASLLGKPARIPSEDASV